MIESPVSAQLKVEIKTEIPAASSGRLVDALVDVIRPFTERRGLKGDLIRLQREEVALKIAELAQHKIAASTLPVQPVPIKGLVKLLEYASLEDGEDEVMVSMWANLLANAATQGDTSLSRFVNILSELNSAQATLLEHIIWKSNPMDLQIAPKYLKSLMDDLPYHMSIIDLVHHFTSEDQAYEFLADVQAEMVRPGVVCDELSFLQINEDSGKVLDRRQSRYRHIGGSPKGALKVNPSNRLDLAVLGSLGLIREENVSVQAGPMTFSGAQAFAITCIWYRLTDLGLALYARCKQISLIF